VTPETEQAAERAAELVREKIAGPDFACVAAKTALRRQTIVHRHFGPLATAATTAALHAELADFARNKDAVDPLLASFVASFEPAAPPTEEEFERLLWAQLQALHELDVTRYAWSALVDPDPGSPRFGFSVGGHPFFVVGLHPGASRTTRRFPLPTLVFNSHVQFEQLKERGVYQRIQREVRVREIELQGSINPNLSDFGEVSEARQYSGLAAPADWRCPFQPRVRPMAQKGDTR
jgi:uncharacterized protein